MALVSCLIYYIAKIINPKVRGRAYVLAFPNPHGRHSICTNPACVATAARHGQPSGMTNVKSTANASAKQLVQATYRCVPVRISKH
jgi:hypothetical protein